MARLKKGLLNGFIGAVGPIEGYELNGQYIIRSRRGKSVKPPSQKQLECRLKMKLVNNLLSKMADFVKVGFAANAEGQTYTAYNAAVAHNIQHAITGDYPGYEIDYSQIRISTGTIGILGLAPTVSLQGNSLYFTWTASTVYPCSTDHVMLLAYAPALNQAVYNLCGAKRREGEGALPLPTGWQEVSIVIYIAFRAENTGQCSNSVYLGKIS